jgi:hypothetical protein
MIAVLLMMGKETVEGEGGIERLGGWKGHDD